jgi:hypothetical protein
VRTSPAPARPSPYLADQLDHALSIGDPSRAEGLDPVDVADGLRALLAVYDLWMAPVPGMDGRERFQLHPVVLALKSRLEGDFLARLHGRTATVAPRSTDAVAALRRIARADAVPPVYTWLSTTATLPQVVDFLAVEGGPDADFDDLVAVCQVGLRGLPKVALAANYWDELGRGDRHAVHTELHDRLVRALAMPRIPRRDLPEAALERSALNGLLATNRSLQPEMVGALGLLELQAGPRCRHVVRALKRTRAPADALPFYQVHAEVDPHHGKDWLDRAVRPLVDALPNWGPRIVRGATWRATVNGRFFAEVADRFVGPPLAGSA